MKQSLSMNNSSTESAPHSDQQLKYENERLKLALAQRYRIQFAGKMLDLQISKFNKIFDVSVVQMLRNGRLN